MESENFYNFKREVKKSPLEISLDDCDISIRAYQFLKSININNLADLADCSEEELVEKSRNHYTIKEIKALLQENNLSLKKDQE
jgi:DNA-directed RNA polymerase alpha subunit